MAGAHSSSMTWNFTGGLDIESPAHLYAVTMRTHLTKVTQKSLDIVGPLYIQLKCLLLTYQNAAANTQNATLHS
jgi:hypothetical protein